jgi:hypothetical protein
MISEAFRPLIGEDRGGYYWPQDFQYMGVFGPIQERHWTGERMSVSPAKADA